MGILEWFILLWLILPVSRYYLFKLFGWGIFVHKIHHSDPNGLFHNRPWNGLRFIWGGYLEETWERGVINVDVKIRRFVNFVPAKRHHRVIVRQPVWARKSNKWSVIDLDGNVKAWEGSGVGAANWSKESLDILEKNMIDAGMHRGRDNP